MKRTTLLLIAAVVAMFAVACSDDSTGIIDGPQGGVPYAKKALSNKSDVLNNIEYAYNKRDMSTYDQLLDGNFTFFYTDGGTGTPVQWGRPDEVTTTSALLAAADKIDLTIVWKDAYGKSTVQWGEQVSGSETWYYATVFYYYTIKIGDTTYIPNAGSKAQFTVRDAGPTGSYEHHWQLIEFRDLGGPSLTAAVSSATEPTSWGKLKALYR